MKDEQNGFAPRLRENEAGEVVVGRSIANWNHLTPDEHKCVLEFCKTRNCEQWKLRLLRRADEEKLRLRDRGKLPKLAARHGDLSDWLSDAMLQDWLRDLNCGNMLFDQD